MYLKKTLPMVMASLTALPAMANDVVEELKVTGRQTNLVGESISASEGYVDQLEIKLRPLLRTGELLELVPGMVATQHSGTGKANQYFLRGFNLDHGTDFATFVDGMPVNMRTHGHGQGYTDVNFLIPEIVDNLAYKKGPYHAEIGDFSSAGSANFNTAGMLKEGELELSVGEDNYQRVLIANSESNVLGGELLYAFELQEYDGPWTDNPEDGDKTNFIIKHTSQVNGGEFSIGLMGYDNTWNSQDQLPERAVENGEVDELGSLDTEVGGESSRYSINAQWKTDQAYFSAYYIDYELDLISNFTYFLDDRVNGDRFQQLDDRKIFGGAGHYHFDEGKMRNTIGADWRYDDINEVGLKTQGADGFETVRLDEVEELSIGLYAKNQMQWNDKLKTTVGIRYDWYDFDVDTLEDFNGAGVDLRPNNGSEDDSLISLKGNVSYAFNQNLEGYFSIGQGFHSNDARGTTTVVDPTSEDPMNPDAIDPVDPLVESLGYEVGFRQLINDNLNISAALWYLELDSELLFVGDAGNTEASGESERNGLEVTAYWRINNVWTADLEYAYSDAEFTNGDEIPGAVEDVIQLGVSADFKNGYYGSFRVRYFGEEPLSEDGEVVGESATIANLLLARDWKQYGVKLEVLNVFDSDDRDIEYFYESRTPAENLVDPVNAGGIEDVHYKVFEPRTFRISGHIKF